ncbi:hypothetical protein LEP48_13355 [Isoptericola sp. NEAU-Y5]|uniref:Histidine phosphatase family protein n=1 Tax=Isoptericola luteus TaxID=2879484 RepID=A0ABS7ZHC9_9MICO|nr:hypothetical protein [Isoptericola sp. NEAU-Y5]MCA5894328.1 hypothetical protein [Isoptericola sp. NEAU-Y5]
MQIVLVRHGAPEVSAAVPARSWPLSSEGRVASARLGPAASRRDVPDPPPEGVPGGLLGVLPASSLAVASTEPKSIETLCLALGTRSVATDARFDEVARPGEPFDTSFRQARRAWVEGTLDGRHAGWEPPDVAAFRFDAAVRAHARAGGADATGTRTLVIGTHGMVLTAWLVSIGRVDPGAPAARAWDELSFPDVLHLEYDLA